jgi:transposase
VLKTLQRLQPDDMFFFIDELGPLRVKKYGGRCYIKKGETSNILRNQPSKGSITLYGALSATTNQVTWNFGKSKDTSAMIDLIEILFNQYYNKSKIYITWDAASWHRSNQLVEWLDVFNAQTKKIRKGPIIELVPLPSCSQFLDVIEAVFSGMKRAVIHHSHYQSEEEMKSAISLHFVERNDYFKKNPKRAGKKIWEIDFFKDYDNIKSGNYRKW